MASSRILTNLLSNTSSVPRCCNLTGLQSIKLVKTLPLIKQTRTLRLWKERTYRDMYHRGRSFDRVKFPESRRDEMQEWNYRSEIFAFSRRLHENLSEDTLRQLFAHQSYVDTIRQHSAEHNLPEVPLQSNQELVDRGVQLIDHCVKPYLRHHFDRMPEDGIIDITNFLKSELVLAEMSDWFGCNDIILCQEKKPSPSTKADTVRALLAAIEKDLGLNRVQRFVVDMVISYLNDKDIMEDVWYIPNPEETLNLILSNSNLPAYEPRLMFQTGQQTLEPCHIVGLYVNKKFIGSSAGETLPIAESCAALNALSRFFDLEEHRRPFTYGDASEQIDYKAHSKEHEFMKSYKIKLEG